MASASHRGAHDLREQGAHPVIHDTDLPRTRRETRDHYERQAFDAMPLRDKAYAFAFVTLTGLSILGVVAAAVAMVMA